ncbi:MAG: hypothetical protein IKF01_04195 [Bacilli bacterium]|nr:hypothetical protein [Bacilli bacterium]
MSRKRLDLSDLSLVIQTMTENSSSAASVIDELLENMGEDSVLAIMIMLDDMNIRGQQLTALYKLFGQNINDFYERVLSICEDDINRLNEESYSVCKYKAIYDGNSFDRMKNPDKYIFTDEERNELRNKKSKDRVQTILKNKSSTLRNDLYPSIGTKEALDIIGNMGFTCGYSKSYDDKDGNTIIYRVFYNEFGDIIYTNSLEKEDVFLYGQCKLNVVRKNTKEGYEDLGCNAYINIDGVVGYNIELREKPFEVYKKILDRDEPLVKNVKHIYYDSNLFPIPESLEAIKYKENDKNYKSIVIGEIYNLLNFKETYLDLDDGLKEIYKPLLDFSEEKAYDEIIYQLNTDKGIYTALELQNVLGLFLDKDKLVEAKDRFCTRNKHHFKIPKTRFLNPFIVEDPVKKDIDKRIVRVLSNKVGVKE